MPQPHTVHPTIRASFEAAVLPAGAAFFPAQDADGILAPEGLTTLFDVPRIEVASGPLEVARIAISLAAQVARGEVLAVLAHHQALPDPLGLPPLHLLEVRLASIEHRAALWRHLADHGVRGLRWLVPPCALDLWKYAVVQGPIALRDWAGILGRARAEQCSHLVSLGAEPPSHAVDFDGSFECVCERPGDAGPATPAWLESASIAFRSEDHALERQTWSMLFGSGPMTVVVRGDRPGFLRPSDRSWQNAPSLDREEGQRCVVSPGPYREARKVLVLDPKLHQLAFHDPVLGPGATEGGAQIHGGFPWRK